MATIQDIVTGAMRKLGVLHGGQTPTAEDSSYALEELNSMMKALDGRQVYVGWTDMGLTEDFPLEGKHEDGVKAMLAVQISNAHGGDPLLSRELMKQKKMGYARLFGDYHNAEVMGVDSYLDDMPSQRLFITGNVAGN